MDFRRRRQRVPSGEVLGRAPGRITRNPERTEVGVAPLMAAKTENMHGRQNRVGAQAAAALLPGAQIKLELAVFGVVAKEIFDLAGCEDLETMRMLGVGGLPRPYQPCEVEKHDPMRIEGAHFNNLGDNRHLGRGQKQTDSNQSYTLQTPLSLQPFQASPRSGSAGFASDPVSHAKASVPAESFIEARGVQEFQAPRFQLLSGSPFQALLRPCWQFPETLV